MPLCSSFKLKGKLKVSQGEHPALQQNMKFLNFFLFLLGHFSFLDPVPDYQSSSRPKGPIEPGSIPDPDPKLYREPW